MTMEDLKEGDIVQLVVSGRYGWESDDWATKAGMKVGEYYEVVSCSLDSDGSTRGVHLRGYLFSHCREKFRKAHKDRLVDAFIKTKSQHEK